MSISLVGRVVANHYRIEKVLGEGAMGAVYLAEHVHMRKHYAMKVLHPEITSAEMIGRFEREAVAAANITHPNVVAATDFGRLDDGSFFMVLEYVAGKSLREVIDAGAMHPRRALAIVRQVLGALGAAHAMGVTHRDIKPENVMLVDRPDRDRGLETVKVLDFGIAKLDESTPLGEESGTPLTRMGTVCGTPAYMAPEQALGTGVDARADLYALGVILFELVSGKPPFEGDGVSVIARHVNDAPPPLTSPVASDAITPELLALVGALVAKRRDDRPADAAAALAMVDVADASLAPVVPEIGEDALAVAPTAAGEPSPVMAPVMAPTSASGAPDGATPRASGTASRVDRFARRLGVPAPLVVVVAMAAASALVLFVLFFIVRGGRGWSGGTSDQADEDEVADPPQQLHATPPTASEEVPSAPLPPGEPAGAAGASTSADVDSMGALPPPPPPRNAVHQPAPSAVSPVAKPHAAPHHKKKGLGSKFKSIFH